MTSPRAISTHKLAETLEWEGFSLPPGTRGVHVKLDVDAAIVVTYEVLVTGDQLTRLSRALAKHAAAQAEGWARVEG